MNSIPRAARTDREFSVVIIADDLSGATDSAVACAERGLDTVVGLDEMGRLGAAEAIAFDADTRRLTADAAAAKTARLVHAHAKTSGRLLFKKLDSTLRGHVGLEIAALLTAARHLAGQQRTIAILAPAFPALGRTTLHGCQHLDGMPLEDTEIWRREGKTGRASLLDMMSCSHLESRLVPIEAVRAGVHVTRAAMVDGIDRIDVLVCDAETDEDLITLARASRDIGIDPVWAGSAGWIGHLLDAAGMVRPRAALPRLASADGPLLFVVGSLSSASRRQAELLAAEDVVVLTLADVPLDKGAIRTTEAVDRFAAALDTGKDVLILSPPQAAPARRDADAFCVALRDLLVAHAERIGGLFATGGDSARAALTGMGISALRPIAEIERGVPLSVAVGPRPIPVITKAGAFGAATTMLNCRRVLQECAASAAIPAPHQGVRI